MNILITHGYSDSNKGDLAITYSTIEALQEILPEVNITLQSAFSESDPDFQFHNRIVATLGINIEEGILPSPYLGSKPTSFLVNIQAVLRLSIKFLQLQLSIMSPLLGKIFGGKQNKALSTLKKADLVVVKGGQFIYNDKEDLRGNLFMWRTLQPIRLANKLNKPSYVLGQSIGPFATEKSKKQAFEILKSCKKLLLREELSIDMANAMMDNKKVVMAPDLAFLSNASPTFENKPGKGGKKHFGVTVVNWSFPESKNPEASRKSYVENLAEAIRVTADRHNLTPLFIPQVTVAHHGKSDLDLIHELKDILEKQDCGVEFLEQDLNSGEMVSVYSTCEFLIGTRLHSCILAAVAHTPVIAIRYQGFKSQGVMKMLGYGHLVHNIYDLESNVLIEDIDNVIQNKNEIVEKLQSTVGEMQTNLRSVLKNIVLNEAKA